MILNRPFVESLQRNRWLLLAPVSLWVLFAIVLLKTAWVCDDAYITFRCVENAVTGHGFGFNADERVQAYTHPLWMLLHLPAQAIWHNPYWTTMVLSLGLTLATLYRIGNHFKSAVIWWMLPAVAVASKAFVEYSTSGLENPLTYFLLTGFALQFWSRKEADKHIFWLSLIAAGMLLNRMDSILLVGPALTWAIWQQRSWRTVGQVALGMLPIFAWETFSVLYYGVPFPNTAYAKLGASIPQSELWTMGLHYFQDSLLRDPVTLPLIGIGLVIGFSRRQFWPWAIGMALYLVYIGRIGGDFMSGRFFAAPFLMAVLLIAKWGLQRPKMVILGSASAVLVSLLGPTPVLLSGSHFDLELPELLGSHGVADERAFYYKGTGLLHAFAGREMPDFEWVAVGKRAALDPPKVLVLTTIGMIGYYAGPTKHVIDRVALADPLLARMPTIAMGHYRPGHYPRAIIPGYLASVEMDANFIEDPAAWDWYEKVRLLTRGPIFSKKRLLLIWRMNTGISRPRDLSHLKMPIQRELQLPLQDTAALKLEAGMGVKFLLPQGAKADSFAIENRWGDVFCLAWLKDGKPLGVHDLWRKGVLTFKVPAQTDAIAIYPTVEYPPSVIANPKVW